MCGIAGIVHGQQRDPENVVRAMQRSIAHRGPDDAGLWRSPSGSAIFAHARLSIIDPSPAGHQPMAVSDGRFTITYNGEIYNFAALRLSLERSGVTFRSNTDTEVILRLYEAQGPASVERLRGMFALAIWDELEQTCFLARDRFGIKPLYYHHASRTLTFASELRALLSAGVPANVSATAAYQYFRTGSIPEPGTLVEKVRALEAGHCMVWRDGQLAIRKYWEVKFPEPESTNEAAPLTRAALLDSLGHHFVSDVPVGIFLSGGMDSTALVALARSQRPGELRTFSLSFPGTQVDEGPEARRTAALFKTEHHELTIDAATGRSLFDQFLIAADQPSIDGFNTFLACKLAHRHHTKVVLSGLGGDELFGGYPSFRRVPRLAKIGRAAQLGGLVSIEAIRLASRIYGSRIGRLSDLLRGAATLGNAYAVFRGIYTHAESLELAQHYIGRPVLLDEPADTLTTDPTPEDGVSRLELTRYMRNQLLRDSDVMSMAFGVELRVPFVDSVVFDQLARLPAQQRVQHGKALLHAAVPEIPDWVARRPKRGFVIPVEQWFADDPAAPLGNVAPPPSLTLDTWSRKMSVIAFERWLQRVIPEYAC